MFGKLKELAGDALDVATDMTKAAREMTSEMIDDAADLVATVSPVNKKTVKTLAGTGMAVADIAAATELTEEIVTKILEDD